MRVRAGRAVRPQSVLLLRVPCRGVGQACAGVTRVRLTPPRQDVPSEGGISFDCSEADLSNAKSVGISRTPDLELQGTDMGPILDEELFVVDGCRGVDN